MLNLIAFLTMLMRENKRIFRIWPQTILPPFITIILYFLIFGKIIGIKIGYMLGYNYISYITPGLIMMVVVNNSYSNSAASFFSAKFQRYLEELLISPIYFFVIINGFVFGSVIRSTSVMFLILSFLYLFFDFFIYDFYLFCLIFIFTAIFFSLLGLINSFFAKKFDDISILPTFILTPLIYFSGVFFSIDLLPDFWKYFVYINPLFYIVNLFRYSFLGISEINIVISFGMLYFLICALYIMCIYFFKLGYGLKK